MATTDISNLNATGFDRALLRTVETRGGMMRPLVRLASGDLYREKGIYPRITSSGLPQIKTNRFGDSPVSEQTYSNRSVTRRDYVDGIDVDRSDLNRMVVDPRNEYVTSLAQRMGRQEDIAIQAAALGAAQGGNLGATSTAFDTNNIIAVGTGALAGNTTASLNYEKIKKTISTFMKNDVMLDAGERPCFVITPYEWDALMDDDKYINFDYNKNRVVNGGSSMIKDFLGADYIVTNIIPYMNTAGTGFNVDQDVDVDRATGKWSDTDTTATHACFAMVKSAVLHEIKPDIITRITERADKQFQPYVFAEMGFGAVRMEEEKVIALPCAQTPA